MNLPQKFPCKNIAEFIDLAKEGGLKITQYIFIFLAWYQGRNGNKQLFNYYYSAYLKIFHSRRLFRLFKSVIFLPIMKRIIRQLKQQFTFRSAFSFLGYLFAFMFYILDNITIILMIMRISWYRSLRRVSYSTLFLGYVMQTISIFIKLRESYKTESNLKNILETMTPTQLLQQLQQIDTERKKIALQLAKILCELFPTLARTNLPEIILRTRINKGTVGFFGVSGGILSIVLKLKGMDFLD